MSDEWAPCPDCKPTDDGGFACDRHRPARVIVPSGTALSAEEWLRVTYAGTLAGRRLEEALAAAEQRGRAERDEQTGTAVAALVARAELAEHALRRVTAAVEGLVQTFDIAQPRIASQLRACIAVDGAR